MTLDTLYDKVINKALALFEKGKYNRCIHWTKFAANILYFSFKTLYEKRIESLIKGISERVVVKDDRMTRFHENRVIFYDSFSYDNRGLTQQYIRALMSSGFHILYMSENQNLKATRIFQELSSCQKVQVYIVPKKKGSCKQISAIYRRIIQYGPSRLLLHIRPSSLECLIAISNLPKEITKYNINITDHAYWAGVSVFDYNLEFRNYGASLSLKQRGICERQILLLPYYPIVDDIPFKGFPISTTGKVVLFFGGNLSKIKGQDNFFLNLIKEVLNTYEQAICFCAGQGDEDNLLSFIKDNGLEKKLIYIGFRNDIYQVIKHCDIFINTYPVGGGLMSQYAAINEKPIVAYSKPGGRNVESLIHTDKIISVYNKSSFFDYIGHLISDTGYRLNEGRSLGSNIPSPDMFCEMLKKTLETNETQYPIRFNEETVSSLNQTDVFNKEGFKISVIKSLGLKGFIYFPSLLPWTIKFLFRRFL